MTAEITGSNPVMRLDDEDDNLEPPYLKPLPSADVLNHARNHSRARFLRAILDRNPWLSGWLRDTWAEARAEGYREGVADTLGHITGTDHAAANPDIPHGLIVALQRGTDDAQLLGDTTVDIDGIAVTINVSHHGTGRPNPDSKTVWKNLRETVRAINAAPYCEHTVSPLLPIEIAFAAWSDSHGKPVSVVPTHRG